MCVIRWTILNKRPFVVLKHPRNGLIFEWGAIAFYIAIWFAIGYALGSIWPRDFNTTETGSVRFFTEFGAMMQILVLALCIAIDVGATVSGSNFGAVRLGNLLYVGLAAPLYFLSVDFLPIIPALWSGPFLWLVIFVTASIWSKCVTCRERRNFTIT